MYILQQNSVGPVRTQDMIRNIFCQQTAAKLSKQVASHGMDANLGRAFFGLSMTLLA